MNHTNYRRCPLRAGGYLSEVQLPVTPLRLRDHGAWCDTRSERCFLAGLRRAVDQLYGLRPVMQQSSDYFYHILDKLSDMDGEIVTLEELFTSKKFKRNEFFGAKRSPDSTNEDLYIKLAARSLLRRIDSLKQDLIQDASHETWENENVRAMSLLNTLELKLHVLLERLEQCKSNIPNNTLYCNTGIRSSNRDWLKKHPTTVTPRSIHNSQEMSTSHKVNHKCMSLPQQNRDDSTYRPLREGGHRNDYRKFANLRHKSLGRAIKSESYEGPNINTNRKQNKSTSRNRAGGDKSTTRRSHSIIPKRRSRKYNRNQKKKSKTVNKRSDSFTHIRKLRKSPFSISKSLKSDYFLSDRSISQEKRSNSITPRRKAQKSPFSVSKSLKSGNSLSDRSDSQDKIKRPRKRIRSRRHEIKHHSSPLGEETVYKRKHRVIKSNKPKRYLRSPLRFRIDSSKPSSLKTFPEEKSQNDGRKVSPSGFSVSWSKHIPYRRTKTKYVSPKRSRQYYLYSSPDESFDEYVQDDITYIPKSYYNRKAFRKFTLLSSSSSGYINDCVEEPMHNLVSCCLPCSSFSPPAWEPCAKNAISQDIYYSPMPYPMCDKCPNVKFDCKVNLPICKPLPRRRKHSRKRMLIKQDTRTVYDPEETFAYKQEKEFLIKKFRNPSPIYARSWSSSFSSDESEIRTHEFSRSTRSTNTNEPTFTTRQIAKENESSFHKTLRSHEAPRRTPLRFGVSSSKVKTFSKNLSNRELRNVRKTRKSSSRTKQRPFKHIYLRNTSRSGKHDKYIRWGEFQEESVERVVEYDIQQPPLPPKTSFTRGTSTEVISNPTLPKRTSTSDLVRLIRAVATNTQPVITKEQGINSIPHKQQTPPSIQMKTIFTNTERTNTRSAGTNPKPKPPEASKTDTATDPHHVNQKNKHTNTLPKPEKDMRNANTDPKSFEKVPITTTATDPVYIEHKNKQTTTEVLMKINAQTGTPPKPDVLSKATDPAAVQINEKGTSYDKIKATERGVNPVPKKMVDNAQQYVLVEPKPNVKSVYVDTEPTPAFGKTTQTSLVVEESKPKLKSVYTGTEPTPIAGKTTQTSMEVAENKPKVKSVYTRTESTPVAGKTTQTINVEVAKYKPTVKSACMGTEPTPMVGETTQTSVEVKSAYTGTEPTPVVGKTTQTSVVKAAEKKVKSVYTGTDPTPMADKTTKTSIVETPENKPKVRSVYTGTKYIPVDSKAAQTSVVEEKKPKVKNTHTGTEPIQSTGKTTQTNVEEKRKSPLFEKETQTLVQKEIQKEEVKSPISSSSSELSIHLLFEKCHDEVYERRCEPRSSRCRGSSSPRRQGYIVCERERTNSIHVTNNPNGGFKECQNNGSNNPDEKRINNIRTLQTNGKRNKKQHLNKKLKVPTDFSHTSQVTKDWRYNNNKTMNNPHDKKNSFKTYPDSDLTIPIYDWQKIAEQIKDR